MSRMATSAIERAVDHFGNQSLLASAVKVTPQFISQLVSGKRSVPPGLALKIEWATDGAISCSELVPELFE